MHMKLEDLDKSKKRRVGIQKGVLRLHKVAARGSPDDIKAIIKSGTGVDARDGLEMTPLMSAACNERIENIKTLLEAGADIGARDSKQNNALHLACSNKRIECTMELVLAGADMQAENCFGQKPLHMSSIYGSKELIEYYLFRSGSLEDLDKLFHTPLLLAAAYGSQINLVTLIDHGADLNAKDECDSNLLHLASENQNSEVLRLALKMGFSTESRNSMGETPLFGAGMKNIPENVRILLEAGADSGAMNKEGRTALHSASAVAKDEVIKLLSNSKSNVDLRDAKGLTALHIATYADNPEAAKALLMSGADINCRDRGGYTPILIAADANRIELVKLLLEAGADCSVIGEDGLNLVSKAKIAMKQSLGDESLKFLLENGVGNQSKSMNGRSRTQPLSVNTKLQVNMKTGNRGKIYAVRAKAFSDWANPLVEKKASAKFSDLLNNLGIPNGFAKTMENWRSMTDVMAGMGFGLAPHWVLVDGIPCINEMVHLYRSTENHQRDMNHNRFSNGILDLSIGAFILFHGKHSSKEVGSALRKTVSSWIVPNENELAGLQSNIEYLRKNPPKVNLIQTFLRIDAELSRNGMRSLAVEFAGALDVAKSKKLATMGSFYKLLKLDPKLARSDLMSDYTLRGILQTPLVDRGNYQIKQE